MHKLIHKFGLIGGMLVLFFFAGYLLLAYFLQIESRSIKQRAISNEIRRKVEHVNSNFIQIRFYEKTIMSSRSSPKAQKEFGNLLVQVREEIEQLHTDPQNGEMKAILVEIQDLLKSYEATFNTLVQLRIEEQLLHTQLHSVYQAISSNLFHRNDIELLRLLFNFSRFQEQYLTHRRESSFQALLMVLKSLQRKSNKSGGGNQQIETYCSSYREKLERDFALVQKRTNLNVKFDDLSVNLTIFFDNGSELAKHRAGKENLRLLTLRRQLRISLAIAIGIGIAGVIFILFLLARRIVNPVRSLAEIAREVRSGNIEARFNPLGDSRDEITQLGVDVNTMLDTLGDREQELIEHRAHLTDMVEERTQELKQSNETLEEINQMQNAQNSLNEIMRGEHDLSVLAHRIISYLCENLGSRIGAFYLMDEDNVLRLIGSYAYQGPSNMTDSFRMGEGLVGQAAFEKKSILLRDCPDDYIRINSGLGDSRPNQIVVFPLRYDTYVNGVIELGTFGTFSDRDLTFIDRTVESIAITISSAQSRFRLMALLEKTQQQSEELQSQHEELRTVNEELEERGRSLQESEEELKSQSEELQSTNEELQEKTEFLEKRQQELEAAKKEVEAKAHELGLASKYKSEFLANMSHEIRSPLNSLLILAKTLANNDDSNLSDDEVEAAKIIYAAGHDLLGLINDILDLSKVEAGKLDIHGQTVDISAMVNEIQDQFLPLAREKGLHFEVEIAPEIPKTFHSDGQRVSQILKNLLSNGIKFTQYGSVCLKIFRPRGDVGFFTDLKPDTTIGFSIIDTGIGIPQDSQEEIFVAFQQADGTTSRQYGGTGLGLTISRELSRLLGGEIQFESVEGKGSTFSLYMPLGEQISLKEVSVVAESPPSPSTEPALTPMPVFSEAEKFIPDDREDIQRGDKTILVIEDDSRFAGVLKDLARKKGYKCLVAGSGGQGLYLASRFLPSAIILDLALPDMDGHTVFNYLKRDLATRPIPMHLISARDETLSSLQQGAIGCLTKPVTTEVLHEVFARIEKLIASRIKHILVVEDDEKCMMAITALIKSKEVNITCMASGGEAYEQLKTGKFDLVILDLQLPDMTGFDLLKKTGRDASFEVPPVIVYTGRELTQAEHNELSRYAKSIVVKGVNSPERLLDETLLFLHSVESSLPYEQREMIRMMHDTDQVLQGRKVLLVDDDLRNTFTLSKILQKHGLEVIIADNGQLALEKLDKEEGIEMIFMDIMMPVMDGYETIRRIRNRKDRLKDLPIIALTAKAMPEDRTLCMEAGANDYMTKPIDLERILSLMRVWLYKYNSNRTQICQDGTVKP